MITPGLHNRYTVAATRILEFWGECRSMPSSWDDMDVATSQWLEHLFAEGYPKGFGSDGLAALQHFVPEVAGKLRHSWKLLKSWQRIEPPIRVLPISPLIVLAMGGLCVRLGSLSCAAAFLVAFDTLLRPGELYGLRKKDITWAGGKAVLSLSKTKTGKRKGAEEMVVCDSNLANRWLAIVLRPKSQDDFLLDINPKELRSLFFTFLDHLCVPGYFSMYSFRRGGATWHFLTGGSLESTLLKGRWASSSSARIYLQDAAATLSHLQIAPRDRSYMKLLASELTA